MKSMTKLTRDRARLIEKAYKFISQGVLVKDPYRLDIRGELTCGKNVIIDINVIIEGEVVLEDGVQIGASCILKDCRVGKYSIIHPFSLVESSVIGAKSFLGPYGRVRPGTKVGDKVQLGNFVEVKNSIIAANCRVNHLAFIGDADLGENVTIGAGTITSNHDGLKFKSTQIGKGAYVGSGCSLIAPLKINSNSFIAAGSTITEDTNSDSLTIARARQVEVKGWKKPLKNKI